MKKRSGLPDGLIFHEDINLLVWKPVGIVTKPTVNTILSFLDHQETVHARPFDRFTDTSVLKGVELNPHYVFQVALYRRLAFSDLTPARSAFYVTKPEVAELIRIHAMVASRSPLKVAMFTRRQQHGWPYR